MIKLKKLLNETYAWQKRNANGSLPTLKDVQKEYQEKKIKEVIKDKDGKVRTDLKYTDNKNYQPRIELVNSENDGSGYPTITVKIDGGAPFDIEFDDHEIVDDHGYEKAIWLMGADEGGGEWGMEGSMAFHGDIEDFDIDTLEKDETKRN